MVRSDRNAATRHKSSMAEASRMTPDCARLNSSSIIDTHQHLWDLSRFRLPWLRPGTILAKSHLMEDYLREAAGLSISKTIYMEVDLATELQSAEAEYVIDLCQREDNPMAG